MKLGYAILLNIFVGIMWQVLQPVAGPGDFLLGYLVGFVLLTLLHPAYGGQFFAVIAYLVFLVWSIIKSSIQVAAVILSPSARLDQGIVAIPLDVTSDFEIATLATSITLTPGTLSIDVGTDDQGRKVLYVHSLLLGDPEAARRDIKEQFERRILRFTRSETIP